MTTRQTRQAGIAATATGSESSKITHALTIMEPWAWAIAAGFKTLENRTWQTSYRGRIAIHASKATTALASEDVRELILGVDPKIGAAMFDDRTDEHPLFYMSCIIGTARIVDCFRIDEIDDEALIDKCHEYPESPTGIPHECWAIGPWCWLLADAERFASPIPARGKLNLWGLGADLEAKVATARANLISDPGQPAGWVEIA